MNALILFDIDKTLLKSSTEENAHKKAFCQAILKSYGVNTTPDKIDHHGMTDQQIIREVLKTEGLDDKQINAKLKLCTQTMCEVFKKNFENENRNVLPGARELLQKLDAEGALLGVVTGNLEPIGWTKLEKARLKKFFKLGAFGSDNADRNQLVKIALKKAEKLGFKENKNVFVIGDTPRDVQAGKTNNAIVFGVSTGNSTEKELEKAGADKVFKSLADSENIIKCIKKYGEKNV